SDLGIKVPNGFAVTTDAFSLFLRHNGLHEQISDQLHRLDTRNLDALTYAGGKIRASLIHSEMPPNLAEAIVGAYEALETQYGPKPDVAVRSSATAEDLPTASFAGQQDSYLNVAGTRNLIATCKLVFASLFTDRAISYREKHGIDHHEVAISVAVQKMVRSDQACSGVMFTLDTESGFRDAVLITSSYGLGENVVKGAVNPDEFFVFKPTLEKGYKPLIKKHLGSKEIKMIYAPEQLAGVYTKNVPVHTSERRQFSIDDDEALTLARYAAIIEDHYSRHAGQPHPMDIEWAKDGYTGELFIVQARPETVEARVQTTVYETFSLREHGAALADGRSVGRRIATGNARVILDPAMMYELQSGEILVTDKTDPDWEPVLKRAAAIVTNRGGRTCHAAIIAREMGIPALVGCDDATETINDGAKVTVSCADGDAGHVYAGILPFDVEKVYTDALKPTKTQIYINLSNPEQAMEASFLPADGVGLVRLEFLMANTIKAHPMALLNSNALDRATQQTLRDLTDGYASPRHFFVDKLAQGVGMIAAAYYPRPINVRFSDFKSSEYASLIGGEHFEPAEENPMIGMRGAMRYFSDDFSESFALECEALHKVRNIMGLTNVHLMIPFVRTPAEAEKVVELLASHALKSGEDGLNIYLMCEIPSNALLAEQFLQHVDGFSIGSNDLTQLALGVDREAGLESDLDERSEATRKLITMAIEACRHADKAVGICGQAPSDYQDFVDFLLEQGIDSISFDRDSLLAMKSYISDRENP
ncbi:MAG TPA: phosphoenolpyruvate synthase, partial [Gammaproteobacteria bacterium]|nr:phosphoenolpyruvate synthase [Gammaproteobacteria bacterium]